MKVVKPALNELNVTVELNRIMTLSYNQNLEHLKALSTIVRIPAMTHQF